MQVSTHKLSRTGLLEFLLWMSTSDYHHPRRYSIKKVRDCIYIYINQQHISISSASDPSNDGVRILLEVTLEVRVWRFDIEVR
jgi:hypothetical protein